MTKNTQTDHKKDQNNDNADTSEVETPDTPTTLLLPKDPMDLEIETLKKQLETVTETGKRLMADMTNLRRRNEEERLKAILYANKNLIKLLLPGLDNLKRALLHIPENTGDWGKGIEMTIRQIEKGFEESGLKKMEAKDQMFNPEFHEAVVQADGEENKILEVLEDGYLLGDQIIRHAKVKIGNGKKEENT